MNEPLDGKVKISAATPVFSRVSDQVVGKELIGNAIKKAGSI
jgi:hypothetical protein